MRVLLQRGIVRGWKDIEDIIYNNWYDISMRKIFTPILIFFLFLSSSAAFADWVNIVKWRKGKPMDFYVDTKSITVEKNRYVLFRSLTNFPEADPTTLIKIETSHESLRKVDCKKKRMQTLTTSFYVGLWASGSPKIREGDKKWKYYSKMKNNPNAKYIIYVCSRAMIWN